VRPASPSGLRSAEQVGLKRQVIGALQQDARQLGAPNAAPHGVRTILGRPNTGAVRAPASSKGGLIETHIRNRVGAVRRARGKLIDAPAAIGRPGGSPTAGRRPVQAARPALGDHPMRSSLLATAAILATASTAAATDLMVAVIEDGAGHVTGHEQATGHDACVTLIEALRKGPVILTLRNPFAKGRVIEARCILPDGSSLYWPIS
jgi:hypothetical protein